jgi:hypothetical protein
MSKTKYQINDKYPIPKGVLNFDIWISFGIGALSLGIQVLVFGENCPASLWKKTEFQMSLVRS